MIRYNTPDIVTPLPVQGERHLGGKCGLLLRSDPTQLRTTTANQREVLRSGIEDFRISLQPIWKPGLYCDKCCTRTMSC